MQLAHFSEWHRTRGCENKRKSDSSTSAWNCSQSPASNGTVPPHFIKAWEETWRRQTAFPQPWRRITQPPLPSFPVVFVSSLVREKWMQKTYGVPPKKRSIPKQNLKFKRHLTLTFIYRRLIKWLIYPKKQWKSVAMWHVKISDLNWKILRPNVRFL